MLNFDINLLFTMINLVILYIIFKKLLYNRVMNVIDQRQKLIDDQFNSAKEAEDKALELKNKWEEDIKGAEAKKEEILLSANQKAKNEYDRIVSEANIDANRIIENANRTISAEKEKAIRQVEDQVADIAMLAAKKILDEKSATIDNGAIYDSFLDDGNDK